MGETWCDRCRGSGVVTDRCLPCPGCGGTGKVDEPSQRPLVPPQGLNWAQQIAVDEARKEVWRHQGLHSDLVDIIDSLTTQLHEARTLLASASVERVNEYEITVSYDRDTWDQLQRFAAPPTTKGKA
jgi:DnaJ-class molecular chaperone